MYIHTQSQLIRLFTKTTITKLKLVRWLTFYEVTPKYYNIIIHLIAQEQYNLANELLWFKREKHKQNVLATNAALTIPTLIGLCFFLNNFLLGKLLVYDPQKFLVTNVNSDLHHLIVEIYPSMLKIPPPKKKNGQMER